MAGDGRDLIPVLAEHPRRDDVIARLVELDPEIAAAARRAVAEAGLEGVVEVIADDDLAVARTGTIRARLIQIPARIARRARRLELHLPVGWRWADA